MATCFDNIKNQGEEQVDCGGPCDLCGPVTALSDSGGGAWMRKRNWTVGNPNAKTYPNHAVKLVLTGAALGTPAYSYVNPTGSDLRFRLTDGTELAYWIESWVDGGTSVLWVKLPSLAPGDTTVEMYFGNPSATFAAAPTAPTAFANTGDNTFLFFDDFNGTFNAAKWQRNQIPSGPNAPAGCGADVASGQLTIYGGRLKDFTGVPFRSHCVGWVQTAATFPARIAVESRMQHQTQLNWSNRGGFYLMDPSFVPADVAPPTAPPPYAAVEYNLNDATMPGTCFDDNIDSVFLEPCNSMSKISPYLLDTWFRQQLVYQGAMGIGTQNVSYTRTTATGDVTITNSTSGTSQNVRILIWPFGEVEGPWYAWSVDWIFARPISYPNPEPTTTLQP
jgi:hypothetical protein